MDHTYKILFFWYRSSIQKIMSFDMQITKKKKKKQEETWPNNHTGHSKVHVTQCFRGHEKVLSHEWFIRNLFARHRLPPAIIRDDSQKPECRSWHLFARHCFRERMKMR